MFAQIIVGPGLGEIQVDQRFHTVRLRVRGSPFSGILRFPARRPPNHEPAVVVPLDAKSADTESSRSDQRVPTSRLNAHETPGHVPPEVSAHYRLQQGTDPHSRAAQRLHTYLE